jgi:hypothetical protein
MSGLDCRLDNRVSVLEVFFIGKWPLCLICEESLLWSNRSVLWYLSWRSTIKSDLHCYCNVIVFRTFQSSQAFHGIIPLLACQLVRSDWYLTTLMQSCLRWQMAELMSHSASVLYLCFKSFFGVFSTQVIFWSVSNVVNHPSHYPKRFSSPLEFWTLPGNCDMWWNNVLKLKRLTLTAVCCNRPSLLADLSFSLFCHRRCCRLCVVAPSSL